MGHIRHTRHTDHITTNPQVTALHADFAGALYGWCAAPILFWIFDTVIAVPLPENELLGFVFNRANIMFGCGVLIGMLCQKYDLPRRPLTRHPFLPWVLIIATSLAAFGVRDWLGTAAVALTASATIIAGLLTPNSGSTIARIWQLLGDASYSIYLTHNIGLLVGATLWIKAFGDQRYEAAIFILAAVVVAGGVVIHLIVEKPLIRLANSFVKNVRTKTEAVA